MTVKLRQRASILAILALIFAFHLNKSPQAKAASFGTAYESAMYVFGGGFSNGISKCPKGAVIVGMAFQHNPMVNGFYCKVINSDMKLDPISESVKSLNPNYIFCPDGKAATGYIFSDPEGKQEKIFAGLACKKPTEGFSSVQYSELISGNERIQVSLNFPIVFKSYCAVGDFMVGQHTWSNYWFDKLAAVCAPFTDPEIDSDVTPTSKPTNVDTPTPTPISSSAPTPTPIPTPTSSPASQPVAFTLEPSNSEENSAYLRIENLRVGQKIRITLVTK